MLSMWTQERLQRLQKLLDSYSNLYTDISFGRPKFMINGLLHILDNIELYRNFIIKNSSRILYGSDVVVTAEKVSWNGYISEILRTYRDFLEKKKYLLFLTQQELNGLHLPPAVLRRIYQLNYQRIFNSDV